ncbi:MAG: right-handed parallel beta-helix repeat-containing protein, partial [Acidobacteriaceae bacterium]
FDPSTMSGADIGAKVNAALATIPRSGGTVRIPAGEYNFSTTIKLTHAGQHLVCDPGATLRYSGNSDAILEDPSAAGGVELDIDGQGGCSLLGTAAAHSGIHLLPGNTFSIRGMRISDFSKGNAIELSGANNVQILSNVIHGNQHGIDMVTVRGYAPNAVHVANNELSNNDWGVYSHNAHVVASRALANVYRDNVLEGNRVGDLFLGWDAHTLVEGNYFESTGVAIAVGTGGDKVYDIHLVRNYFTVAGAAGYRSEIELGDGSGFFIEGNYEEGGEGAGTGCAVNVVPGIRGGASNVLLRNPFSRVSEREISAHEFCYEGTLKIPPGVLGEWRMAGDVSVDGSVQAKGAQLSGPLELGQGAVASTDSSIKPNDVCSSEGMLLISRPANQPARLFFCSGFHWQAVVMPHR